MEPMVLSADIYVALRPQTYRGGPRRVKQCRGVIAVPGRRGGSCLGVSHERAVPHSLDAGAEDGTARFHRRAPGSPRSSRKSGIGK